uniref:MFS domain-containing protein n=1 Tax=Steinernema glaseri TaxID=37863 RepID=A0A1I7YYH7_9BILA
MRPLQKAKLIATCVALSYACNLQYGYSSVYLNTPVEGFKTYLNESLTRRGWLMTEDTYSWMWNLILNIWFVGFFFGVWLSPFLNDRYGRKVGFILMNTISLLGSITRYLGTLLYVPELLFIGRILVSIATAVTYQSQILYFQECSPTKLRGSLSFFSDFSFSTMALLGMSLGTKNVFGDHISYLLGVMVIPYVNLQESVAQWSSTSMAMCYTLGTMCGAFCIER